jgi:hypothetical protein
MSTNGKLGDCGCGCNGAAGGCGGAGANSGEQALSPYQYWATQWRLTQYQGCPGCMGGEFLAPVRKSGMGAIPFGELTWTACTAAEVRSAIPYLASWPYTQKTPLVLAMWYGASFGVGWYYKAVAIPGQEPAFYKSQACPNYGTVGPLPVAMPTLQPANPPARFFPSLWRTLSGPAGLGQAAPPPTTTVTTTTAAPTSSTGTIVAVSLVAAAAGAALAYGITRHHDRKAMR